MEGARRSCAYVHGCEGRRWIEVNDLRGTVAVMVGEAAEPPVHGRILVVEDEGARAGAVGCT